MLDSPQDCLCLCNSFPSFSSAALCHNVGSLTHSLLLASSLRVEFSRFESNLATFYEYCDYLTGIGENEPVLAVLLTVLSLLALAFFGAIISTGHTGLTFQSFSFSFLLQATTKLSSRSSVPLLSLLFFLADYNLLDEPL